MRKYDGRQAPLFPLHEGVIPLRIRENLAADAVRLAILIYVGAESFERMCAVGELNFVLWQEYVNERVGDHGLKVSEEELDWLQGCIVSEPRLKARLGDAREKLNARLRDEPVLPVGAMIALFMDRHIKEGETILRSIDVGEPTALITLKEPLHFECTRGDIFQLIESPVVARMNLRAIPGGLGGRSEEARHFVLKSPDHLTTDADAVYLAYPSLNKAFPGIFSRLHLGEGKQNNHRSIYYHAAWAIPGAGEQREYLTLWKIRDEVFQRTWVCPSL